MTFYSPISPQHIFFTLSAAKAKIKLWFRMYFSDLFKGILPHNKNIIKKEKCDRNLRNTSILITRDSLDRS